MLSIKLNNHQINIDSPSILEKDISNTVFSSLIFPTSATNTQYKIKYYNNIFTLEDPNNVIEYFTNLEELIYTLEWKLVDYLINEHMDFLQFHGASLLYKNQGYTFVGNPGTGKTSLSILLMKNGFTFLSDEVTLIDNIAEMISPFPRNLIIKQHLLDKIKIPKNALSIKIDGDTGKKEIAFFLSPNIFGKTETNKAEINKIFFLHNSKQKDFTLIKIGQHEAFNQLIPQLFNPQLLQKYPEVLTKLTNRAKCYNLFINKPLHFDEKQTQDLLTAIIDG